MRLLLPAACSQICTVAPTFISAHLHIFISSYLHIPGACSHRHESVIPSFVEPCSIGPLASLWNVSWNTFSHSRLGASEWVVSQESASAMSRRPCSASSACAIMWKRTNTSQAPQMSLHCKAHASHPGSLPGRDPTPVARYMVICCGRVAQTGWDTWQNRATFSLPLALQFNNLFAASMACPEIARLNLPIIRWGAPCNVIASNPDLWNATRL